MILRMRVRPLLLQLGRQSVGVTSRISRNQLLVRVPDSIHWRSFFEKITRDLTSAVNATRTVKFVSAGQEYTGKGKIGDSLLDVVVNNDLPLDGYGACEGTLACCTCHVILDEEHFGRQEKTNPASEEELDLLDLAPELDDRSRLGCQVKIEAADPDVIIVRVPAVTRDARTLE